MSYRNFCVVAMSVGVMCASAVRAEVFEDDFKSYPDFAPAIGNWMFRGVGGEVIDGSYMFSGVRLKSSEYFDVHPDYAMGLVRGWPAGPVLDIVAVMKAVPHKYKVFQPEKGESRKMGIAVLDREFVRKSRTPMDTPFLELTLNESPTGKRDISFSYRGKPEMKLSERVITPGAEWSDGVEYRFEISLRGGKAVGTVSAGGRVVYSKSLEGEALVKVFSRAYPAFCNRKMIGKLEYFKADNQDSAPTEVALRPLPIPERWNSSLGGEPLLFENGGSFDFGKLYGGHGKEKTVVLSAELTVPESGGYAVKCKADWFWKLSVNGKAVTPEALFTTGGPGKYECFIVPLKKGVNKLELSVKSGSAGWSFSFLRADEADISNHIIGNNLYGSGKTAWNIDRLLDDIAKLKRHGISLDKLEAELVGERRNLRPDLNPRRIATYDPLLDKAYAAVYDGYRIIELENAISELKALDVPVNELENLAKGMRTLFASGGNIDKDAVVAGRLLEKCRAETKGFAEGVTRGGSFGRFGWVTSDKLGAYSSGDGLLANQVLSNGAIARQYISSVNNSNDKYLVRFRFDGERDSSVAEKLAALPTIGRNVEIEFGYAPTLFYSGSTPQQVRVNAINWTRKQHSFAEAFVMDASLVSPSLLLESAAKDFELSDSPSGAFGFIAWKSHDGKICSSSASAEGLIYARETDGQLGSNWIMLWNGGNSETDLSGHRGNVPLQVIFQRQPEHIVRRGRQLVFSFTKAGALWLNTPFGVRLQPTGNWHGKLPPVAAAKADFFGRAALAYPENVREFYRYDKDKRQVEILNKYTFRTFADNDWRIEPLKLAVLPPLLSLMTDKGFDAVLPEGIRDLGYPTLYGPLRGVEGSEITYTLPVPDVPEIDIPANTGADAGDVALLRQRGMNEVEGQRFRFYDEAMCRSWFSLNFPGHGIFKQWQYLSPEFREYLMDMFAYNLVEVNGYRDNRLWRSLIEPYSGRKYFYSFSISSRDPGDVGVFGDRGYGVGLHYLLLDKWSAYSGRNDVLQKIWRDERPLAPPDASRDGKYLSVDKMAGYINNVHDWAWMENGSNDNGDNGPVVDCSQAPFAGHCAYFRMASRVGNERELARGAYFLSKAQLSLIGRLPFTDYGRDNGLLGIDNINVGFRECITPDCFANSSMLAKTKRSEYDGSYVSTLSYATSDDGFDIYFPYAKYIWNTMRDYENIYQAYFPNSDTDSESHGHLFSRLMFLVLSGEPLERVRSLYDHQSKHLIFYLRDANERTNIPLLISGGCPMVISGWAPLPVPVSRFNPSNKSVEVLFDKIPADYTLNALSVSRPAELLCNGKPVEWSYDPGSYRLAIRIPSGGESVLTVRYSHIDTRRFTPIPTPETKRVVPAFASVPRPEDFVRASRNAAAAPSVKKPAAPVRILHQADFSGGAPDNPSAYYYKDWGKSKASASGGFTGSYPAAGIPANALEVKTCSDNFSGRVSPKVELPQNTGDLTLEVKLLRSGDYRGNTPMIMLWIVGKDGKGKPLFFNAPAARGSGWQEWSFKIPAGEFPAEPAYLFINLTSRKDNDAGEVSGSVFYRDLRLSAAR